MKKNHKKISKSLRKRKELVFISVFVIVGVVLLLGARAATSTLNFETENSLLSGKAGVISDTDASGGQAITFGSYPVCAGVTVSPGDNIQDIVNANSEGATFCFEPGTYNLAAAIIPKNNQKFRSEQLHKAILTGNDSTDMSFNGEARFGITIDGFIIEKFASPATGGYAAVKASSDWTIINNEIRYNHANGVYHESRAVLRNNFIHHNGKLGIGSFKAADALIENNEVSYNHVGWPSIRDTGGSKWVGSTNIVIRNNYFHHNDGNGIWLDGDNLNALVENNKSNDNVGRGFFYEISCAGIVRNNTATGNNHAGLSIDYSRDVEAYGNYIADNAKGITVWHTSNRGSGPNCVWDLHNIRIHDNEVKMSEGYSGILRHSNDDGTTIFEADDGRVKFYDNDYTLSGFTRGFHVYDNTRTFSEWQGYGQDPGSTIQFN